MALRKVPQIQDDTERHVNDTEDDGQFHFVRVEEDDFVFSYDPHGIHAERIRILPIVSARLEIRFTVQIESAGCGPIRTDIEMTIGYEHCALHTALANQVLTAWMSFAWEINDPSRAEYVERFGEEVVVYKSGVNGKETHQ